MCFHFYLTSEARSSEGNADSYDENNFFVGEKLFPSKIITETENRTWLAFPCKKEPPNPLQKNSGHRTIGFIEWSAAKGNIEMPCIQHSAKPFGDSIGIDVGDDEMGIHTRFGKPKCLLMSLRISDATRWCRNSPGQNMRAPPR